MNLSRPPGFHGHRLASQCLAWAAHLYTAMGLIIAALIAVLIVRGDAASFRLAFLAMLVATLVDASDGSFARLVRVREVLPHFDGRRLDDIIDFLNYTALPLLLFWRTGMLPGGTAFWILVPLVASAYGFCRSDAKSDDGYFIGFPSYWNVVVFYLYVLQLPTNFALGLLLLFTILTFVPLRYLYPTQSGRLNRVTTILGVAWAGLLLWALFRLPIGSSDTISNETHSVQIAAISLWYPAFYLTASWLVSYRVWAKRRTTDRECDRIDPVQE